MSKFKKIVIAAVVSLLVAAGVAFSYYGSNLEPVSNESQPVVFKVESGETLFGVLNRLESEGIIKSSLVSKVYSKINNVNTVYLGNFNLDKSWTTPEILNQLSNKSNALPETVSVLLVEGSWAKDMAKMIASKTNTSEARFLELWNDPVYIGSLIDKYAVLPEEILLNNHAKVLLEGFLYPDTYSFRIDDSEEMITETILKNSEHYYNQYKEDLSSTNFTHYELMTLASIVEYEANTDEDMRNVAGVFMNRLYIDMMLQSSVTVCYALYDFDSWEDCERYQPDSPYNTYLNAGLTPGPILNPSYRAIQATLNYTKHDYFFFIADVYGDQSVHYQKTYAEHEKVRMELLGY